MAPKIGDTRGWNEKDQTGYKWESTPYGERWVQYYKGKARSIGGTDVFSGTKLKEAFSNRNKEKIEEKSKTHYQTESRRGHKKWVPKTQEMLDAEKTDWDKQFDVKGQPAINYFTQAIENDLELDDFKRETLLKSRLSFENAYQFEDATTDFVKATELAKLAQTQGDTNLFTGNINYLDETAGNSDGTSDGDTSITNNIVENQTATGALTSETRKDDEFDTWDTESDTTTRGKIGSSEWSKTGDANQMTIGSKPWVRGKGTSYKDANAATEALMEKEGYDLRGLGISQKQDLFSAYRSGRTHKTDKGLFHNQKLIRKR